MRDGCETGKRRKRQRKGGRKRKTDHYIADHNFSFSLHALLILQEEKVKRGKISLLSSERMVKFGILNDNLKLKNGNVVGSFYISKQSS